MAVVTMVGNLGLPAPATGKAMAPRAAVAKRDSVIHSSDHHGLPPHVENLDALPYPLVINFLRRRPILHSGLRNQSRMQRHSVHVALNEISKISSFPRSIISKTNDAKTEAALEVCQTMVDDSMDRLNESISSMDVNQGQKILSD